MIDREIEKVDDLIEEIKETRKQLKQLEETDKEFLKISNTPGPEGATVRARSNELALEIKSLT